MLLPSVFYVLTFTALVSHAIKPYQMVTVFFDAPDTATCKSHEFVKVKGLSGYIYSHDFETLATYRPEQQCFLTIEVPENYQVAIEALELDLGYPQRVDNCRADSLFIFDNQAENGKIFESNLEQLGEFCHVTNNRTLLATSSNNSITLYWHAVPLEQRNSNAKGFKLKWTVQRKTVSLRPETLCNPIVDFTCSNEHTCIPLELACDNEQHCTDGSDVVKSRQLSAGCENIEADSILDDLSSAAIVGIILSFIIITVLLTVIVSCCCVSRHKKQQTLSSRNSLTYQPAPTNANIVKNSSAQNSDHSLPPPPANATGHLSKSNNFYTNGFLNQKPGGNNNRYADVTSGYGQQHHNFNHYNGNAA